ncbi:hypothetical protein GQX74_010071 [Glossina fuscipes]|nr:hypothetical protein GQX74_010071 [Glossina fuscipes]
MFVVIAIGLKRRIASNNCEVRCISEPLSWTVQLQTEKGSSGPCNLHISSYSVATSPFGLSPSVALVELLHLTSPNPVSAIGYNTSKQIVLLFAIAENKNVRSSLKVNYADAVEMPAPIAPKSRMILPKIMSPLRTQWIQFLWIQCIIVKDSYKVVVNYL